MCHGCRDAHRQSKLNVLQLLISTIVLLDSNLSHLSLSPKPDHLGRISSSIVDFLQWRHQPHMVRALDQMDSHKIRIWDISTLQSLPTYLSGFSREKKQFIHQSPHHHTTTSWRDSATGKMHIFIPHARWIFVYSSRSSS